jgi:hypothetical protein
MDLWQATYQIALDNAMRMQSRLLDDENPAKRHEGLQEVKHIAKACANTAVYEFEQKFEPKA